MKSFILVVGMAGSLFAEEASDSFYQAFQYRNIGPTRGGRVTAVEGVVKSPGTFYMGATGGGFGKPQISVLHGKISQTNFLRHHQSVPFQYPKEIPMSSTWAQVPMAYDQM